MRKLFFVISLFFLTSCGNAVSTIPVSEQTEKTIFEAGVAAMDRQEYNDAAQFFAEIKDNYPFSDYVVEAELNLGDALFLSGQYLFAADAYSEFEDLHPRHDALPYVLYQVAKSMRISYTSIDRTTTDLEIGLLYAKRVESEYPNSEYAALAKEEILTMRILLAKRELFIANVYWNMDNPESAWYRYSQVAKQYQDLEEIHLYAKKRAEKAFLKFRKQNAETQREAREGTWKNWLRWL